MLKFYATCLFNHVNTRMICTDYFL